MAKRKYPDISKYAALEWEKIKPENYHEVIDQCKFCGRDIKDNEEFFSLQSVLDMCLDGEAACCTKCALASGMEW